MQWIQQDGSTYMRHTPQSKSLQKNDAVILIHELLDYDTNSKYRKNYSAMGLKRITTVSPNH